MLSTVRELAENYLSVERTFTDNSDGQHSKSPYDYQMNLSFMLTDGENVEDLNRNEMKLLRETVLQRYGIQIFGNSLQEKKKLDF